MAHGLSNDVQVSTSLVHLCPEGVAERMGMGAANSGLLEIFGHKMLDAARSE